VTAPPNRRSILLHEACFAGLIGLYSIGFLGYLLVPARGPYLAFDRRHSRRRFRLFLVPVVGLWLSTVYLRYHYLVDLLAGFALAALAWRAVCRPPSSLQFLADGPSLHRGR
jgi:membrane-associated phospholipid phosphatase